MIFNSILGIWITAGIIIAFAMPPAKNLAVPPIMYFHVPMAVATSIAFLIAAWYGAAWLKTRRVQHDMLSYAFAEVGAICGLIATATGSIWARINWGHYWSWDPQQVGIVATLLIYGALFSLRAATEDEDKQRNLWAVYAIFGAVAAIFWLFIYRHLPGVRLNTAHPSGTLSGSEPIFRFALWFNVAGYVMLLVRLAQLRARLERANQYLKDLSWT
ncbi:MAG TPA: cytochrome c biogenesis protein CcsA [Abditibacteriaceae bacterium]|nr:cytochrome c biogenesis protein CcsA [Abditibacteriaceae bacterium]